MALFLAAAAPFLIAREGSAKQGPGDVNVQRGWAYIERGKDAAVERVAAVFLVKLHSSNVPTALFEAKSVEYNQIFVAPLLMRHIMPLLMQEDEIVVSIPERDGPRHDYTFSMQPNDLALGPIRACFDF